MLEAALVFVLTLPPALGSSPEAAAGPMVYAQAAWRRTEGNVPLLSQLTGGGGFANPRLNDALGHAAFDYIESRCGAASIRRFINALIIPRVDKTYDAVFDLTPAEFDAAYRQYVERRFSSR
jgi:hypothetical protein